MPGHARWLLLLALLLPAAARAAPQPFGLLQYQPPDGTLTEGQATRAWQLVQGRSFCQFVLYLPLNGTGDARADFAAEWEMLAKGRGAPGPAPAPAIGPAPAGWTRAEGRAEERTEAVGRYGVRQLTFSGHGRRMSAAVVGNDEGLCGARGQAFLAGLKPLLPPGASPAPVASPAPPPPSGPAPAGAGAPPALTSRAWYKAAASYSHWGSNFNLGELAKLGSQGYATRTWQFGADGRYRYRFEVWSMTLKPAELSGIEDVGRWRVEGDLLVVEPERAVAYVEERASHRRLREEPARTARTTYRWRNHYLSGMGEWYLVLAPVDGKVTDREGDFDGHPSFPGAYLYGAPPRVKQ